jgi:hypothetical protein
MHVGQLRKFFLREAFLETKFTHVDSERNSWVRTGHVVMIEAMTTMSLHTMSVIH